MALLEELFQDLAARFLEGPVLVGGEEARLLREATVDSFTQGVLVATLLCAQAACERALAGLISLRELPAAGIAAPEGWDRGLGRILGRGVSPVRP